MKEEYIDFLKFVDSAMDLALAGKGNNKKVNKILIGADALLKKGIINKVGSGMLGKLAKINKIPLYVVADSWKYSSKEVKIEERDFHEVWKSLPKDSQIKIRNPAFEFLKKKYILEIITEFGILSYRKFLKIVKKEI